MEITEQLLSEASNLDAGARQRDYGTPYENHLRIAALWNVYLARKRNKSRLVSAYDVSVMMMLLKIARLMQNPSHDSHVDLAGYAAVAEAIHRDMGACSGDDDGG